MKKRRNFLKIISSILGMFVICGAFSLCLFNKRSEAANVNAMSEGTLRNVTCTFTSNTPLYSDYEFVDDLYSDEEWNYDYTYNNTQNTDVYTSTTNAKQKYFVYRISTYVRPLSNSTFRTYKYLLIAQQYTYSEVEFISGVFQGQTSTIETKSLTFRVFSSLEDLTYYNINDDETMPMLNLNTQSLRIIYDVSYHWNGGEQGNTNPSSVLIGDINFVNGDDIANSYLLAIFNRMCTFQGYNSYTDEFMTATEYQQIIDDLNLRIDNLEISNNTLSNQVEIAYQQGYTNAQHHYEVEMENYGRDKYLQGYGEGYREGFNADSTATTIFTGILSVAMVPINFFLGIFNFEILGINLSAFIKAVFTVMLTIIVVKVVLAKES